MTRHRVWWALPLLVGCTTEGELGRGTFDYECVGDEDAACWDVLSPLGVPARIAVGGLFVIEYRPFEGVANHAVVPASSERASTDSTGTIQLVYPGTHALLARHLTSDAVSDYLNVEAVEIADLFVSREQDPQAQPIASIEIEDGEPTTFYARPVAADGQRLSGALPLSWSVADEGIATVEPATDNSAEATVTPQRTGSTTLTISGGGVDATYALRVEPGATP